MIVGIAVVVSILAMIVATVQIVHYYNPNDYRLIKMASYKLHTFVAYTYFGMCINHKPNHPHSIRRTIDCYLGFDEEKEIFPVLKWNLC